MNKVNKMATFFRCCFSPAWEPPSEGFDWLQLKMYWMAHVSVKEWVGS